VIKKAVMEITAEKLNILFVGKMGYFTTDVGDMVAEFV
jgi:hypothetical protein